MEPLPVTKKRAQDIARISDIPAATIRAICEAIASKGFSGSHKTVSRIFRDQLGEEDSSTLFSHAMSLTMHADDEQESIPEILERLRLGLERFGWSPEELSKFDGILPEFQHLLELKEFYLAVKSWAVLNLGVSHLHKLKIFTEIKPIFSKDRKSVLASVIKSDLVLVKSSSSENEKEMVVSLSISDLKKMRSEVENAISKIEATRAFLSQSGNTPAVVYGDDA